eukprot:jgi/Tetstr1/428128/TSEL_018180.t1
MRGEQGGGVSEATSSGAEPGQGRPRKLRFWMKGVTAHHRGPNGKLKVYPGVPRATGPEGYFGSKEPRRSSKRVARERRKGSGRSTAPPAVPFQSSSTPAAWAVAAILLLLLLLLLLLPVLVRMSKRSR